MKYLYNETIFYNELLMVYRFILFFVNIFLMLNLHAMRDKYNDFPKEIEVRNNTSLQESLSFESLGNQIAQFTVIPLTLSFVNTIFDANVGNVVSIDQKSTSYHLAKAVFFSSICGLTGQTHLIPGIWYNAHHDMRGAYRENFLQYATNLIASKTLIVLTKHILLPASLYPGQIVYIFPLAKFGFFENKKFLTEPVPLRLAQVAAWHWDLGIEPFLYNLFLEKQKATLSITNIATFFAIFSITSFFKYFFYKKLLFEKTDIYEGFSTKEWFAIELIGKYAIPWLLFVSKDIVHESIDTQDFVTRSFLNIIAIAGIKGLFLYLQEQHKNRFFQRYIRDFNKLNAIMSSIYKKIGI